MRFGEFFVRMQPALKFAFVLTIPALLAGQTSASFEVASVRPNRSGSLNTQISLLDGGRLSIRNASLKTLIRNAYALQAFQFDGGPAWLDTDMYDIEAKTGRPEKISEAELPALLQSLMADRFHLKVHWESREATVYALQIDKGGLKMKASSGDETPAVDTGRGVNRMHIKGVAQPLTVLTQNLANRLGRVVTDQTGLSGKYDFSIEWDPQSDAESAGPSLFTVLKEQLGLRLETQKGHMDVLVVDSAEKASDN
jgi:uncharacterized protein (TIGR03435 family)